MCSTKLRDLGSKALDYNTELRYEGKGIQFV